MLKLSAGTDRGYCPDQIHGVSLQDLGCFYPTLSSTASYWIINIKDITNGY